MTPQSDSVIHTKAENGITYISINRPQQRNAVDSATGQELYEAFLAYEKDVTQKVCVFSGSYGNFCAGADLHETARSSGNASRDYLAPVDGRNRAHMGPSRLQVKKPVICAVAGYAVAGGLELSLIGDIRVAEENAIFGVFCRRWGVPLIDGGTVRLPAIVGVGRALDMILTGRPVDAQEALAFGLANRVVPKGQAVAEATKIAKQLITFPQLCMNTDRNSCYHAAYNANTFDDALRFEFDNGVKVISEESIKGATRFSSGLGRHGAFESNPKL